MHGSDVTFECGTPATQPQVSLYPTLAVDFRFWFSTKWCNTSHFVFFPVVSVCSDTISFFFFYVCMCWFDTNPSTSIVNGSINENCTTRVYKPSFVGSKFCVDYTDMQSNQLLYARWFVWLFILIRIKKKTHKHILLEQRCSVLCCNAITLLRYSFTFFPSKTGRKTSGRIIFACSLLPNEEKLSYVRQK